jgi:hypothetical protein
LGPGNQKGHADAGARVAIIYLVDTGSAVENVVAVAAAQSIVGVTAGKHVIAVAAA